MHSESSSSSGATSASLLERVCDRADEPAWERLAKIYTPLLQTWLRSAGPQPADCDDLTQRALEIVFRKVHEFQPSGRSGSFRAWLRGIVMNLLREHRRSRQTAQADLAAVADSDAELERRWDREHDEHLLRSVLRVAEPDFSPATWQAFRRQVLDEAPAAQVAAEMGLSVNAALIAKSRVLARLRRESQGLIGE